MVGTAKELQNAIRNMEIQANDLPAPRGGCCFFWWQDKWWLNGKLQMTDERLALFEAWEAVLEAMDRIEHVAGVMHKRLQAEVDSGDLPPGTYHILEAVRCGELKKEIRAWGKKGFNPSLANWRGQDARKPLASSLAQYRIQLGGPVADCVTMTLALASDSPILHENTSTVLSQTRQPRQDPVKICLL